MPAGRGQDKALDKLESKEIQQRVEEYLSKHELPNLKALVDLDPRGITYTPPPPNPRVSWVLQPAKPKLTIEEENRVRKEAKEILKEVLGQTGPLSKVWEMVQLEVTFKPSEPPPPITEVDEDAIRQRARELIDEKPPYVRLVSQFVVLNPDGIFYRRTRKPGALTWVVTTRSDITGYESLIKSNVYDILLQVLGSYKGKAGKQVLFNAQALDKIKPLIEIKLRTPPRSTEVAQAKRSHSASSQPANCPVPHPPEPKPRSAPAAPAHQPRMPGAEEESAPPGRRMPRALDDEDAETAQSFQRGYAAYWEGKYRLALVHLHAAIRRKPEDARFWYYRGLAEMELNQRQQAMQSFETALDLHRRGKPGHGAITESLARVQGPMQEWFSKALEVTQSAATQPLVRK